MRIVVVSPRWDQRFPLAQALKEHSLQFAPCLTGLAASLPGSALPVVLVDSVLENVQAADILALRERFGMGVPLVWVGAWDDRAKHFLAQGGCDVMALEAPVEMWAMRLKCWEQQLGGLGHQCDLERELRYLRAHMRHDYGVIDKLLRNARRRSRHHSAHIRYYSSPKAESGFNGDLLLAAQHQGDSYLLLCDFSGHGLPAAIGGLPVSEVFFSMTAKGCQVADIAREINRHLFDLLPGDRFCAGMVVKMSACGDRLEIWSGGMLDGLLLAPDARLTRIPAQHMPLGTMDEAEFTAETQHFRSVAGSRLLLFSDGLVEQPDAAGEPFGEERVAACAAGENNPLAAVITAWKRHAQGVEHYDDITVVELICG